MVVSILIGFLLFLVVVLCVSSILYHHRLGELCECSGDCAHCTIKCRSNEKYYGVQSAKMPAVPAGFRRLRRTQSKLSRVLKRVRDVVDFICYWIFNLSAIACILMGLVRGISGLFA